MSSVQLLNLPGFAQKGINTDLPAYTLDGDYLTEASNMRIVLGRIFPFGGHSIWDTLPVDFLPGYINYHGTEGLTFWVIPGADSVLAYDGGTFHDISNLSAGGYSGISDPDGWSSCKLTNIIVLNHDNHHPEYWPDINGATPLEYLPWDATQNWSEANQSCRVMRSHKQFLFAMDLVVEGVDFVDGIRWSSPADIGGVPASWDHLDVTNVAGLVGLGGDGGRIIDGLSMRDAFIVYRSNGITIFDYVGGQFVWRIRHLSTTQGLISQDAIVEVRGSHYFISNGDIFKNDGNTITSILHNRLRRRFVNGYDIEKRHQSFVIHNKLLAEIWFCITELSFEHPNIAYIYNYEDDSWSLRDLPELGPYADYGPQIVEPIIWDTTPGTWDNQRETWSAGSSGAILFSVISVSKPSGPGLSGELRFLDKNGTDPTTQYHTSVERIGFPLAGLDNVTTITRVYPHLTGVGTILVEIGSQDHINAPVKWKPGILFEAGVDRKVDVRTTGELHCFRFSSDGPGNKWELSGMDIEYVMAGKR